MIIDLSSPRMLLSIIAGIIVVLIGVGIWCAWRFLKKKRPQGTAEEADDEKDLVGGMEEEPEEIEEVQQNTDFKGRIHYRLEYDFTTQELKVTVRMSGNLLREKYFVFLLSDD